MPEISRFYGIVIKMFYDDHPPPHFHAEYGSDSMVVDITTLAVISGRLPPESDRACHGMGCLTPASNFMPIGSVQGIQRNCIRLIHSDNPFDEKVPAK